MRGRGFGGRGFGPGPRMRPGMGPVLRPRPFGRRLVRPLVGWRPIPWGMFTLLTFAGSGLMYKIHRDDATRLEQYSSKPVQEMSEEEVEQAMKALNIKNEPLSAEDRQAARQGNQTTMSDLELLEKLTQMHYSGVISEEEYTAKRKQILGL